MWETPTDPSVLAEVHNTGVPIISEVIQNDGVAAGIREALTQFSSLGANALDVNKVTTLQANLDSLIPGLAAVGLTLLCCWLLKKKVSPIAIILALFVVGIVGRVLNFM